MLILALLMMMLIDLVDMRQTSYYWDTRRLQCITASAGAAATTASSSTIARCSVYAPDRVSELNPFCFDEPNVKGSNETRTYCRVRCEEADETTVLAKKPAWNHLCNAYFTYQLERRREDWYLWRSGTCMSTTITFEIRCGFPRDPRVFYRDNHQLFEYADADDQQQLPSSESSNIG